LYAIASSLLGRWQCLQAVPLLLVSTDSLPHVPSDQNGTVSMFPGSVWQVWRLLREWNVTGHWFGFPFLKTDSISSSDLKLFAPFPRVLHADWSVHFLELFHLRSQPSRRSKCTTSVVDETSLNIFYEEEEQDMYTQNYCAFLICPSSGILENSREHNVSETGSVSVLR
jgi:hypothetical protein